MGEIKSITVSNIYLRNFISTRLSYSSIPSKFAALIGYIPENWQFNDLCCIYLEFNSIYISRSIN